MAMPSVDAVAGDGAPRSWPEGTRPVRVAADRCLPTVPADGRLDVVNQYSFQAVRHSDGLEHIHLLGWRMIALKPWFTSPLEAFDGFRGLVRTRRGAVFRLRGADGKQIDPALLEHMDRMLARGECDDEREP